MWNLPNLHIWSNANNMYLVNKFCESANLGEFIGMPSLLTDEVLDFVSENISSLTTNIS